ncbi:hypothetical protein ACH5RR_002848 [Cinchona calisaya]|uniref:Glycosyltransferase n=1 Tax=Cinchona calisaya TaxID=153742 RepID=A0ABD3ATS1_9GENT
MADHSTVKNQNNGHSGVQETQVTVVMVPLPAQGHLNQLLHLSRFISSYGVPVHYVAPTTYTRQAKDRVQGWDPLVVPNIHFHEISIPSHETPSPNPIDPKKFSLQLVPSFSASIKVREPIYALLKQLSSTTRRLVVVHDSVMPYAIQDVRLIANAESYCFHSISAFTIYTSIWEQVGKPGGLFEPELLEILDYLPSNDGCSSPEAVEFVKLQLDSMPNNSAGNLYNSCRVIEGPFLDLLAKAKHAFSDKQWVIGPFNPVVISNEQKKRHYCLDWLDKQASNSVLFVSFGSSTTISDAAAMEIAIGLEKSEQKFIWVFRDADAGDVFEAEVRRAKLPEGFEERIGGRGLILRDWAPQLDILGHSSTGGFMSHCGWNSCMESISMGVPIAAWPMKFDQPRNSILIEKVLQVGLLVRDWSPRDELVPSIVVENVVRRLMDSTEGEEMRQRAKELSKVLKESVMDGGVSRLEMDSFIAHIRR